MCDEIPPFLWPSLRPWCCVCAIFFLCSGTIAIAIAAVRKHSIPKAKKKNKKNKVFLSSCFIYFLLFFFFVVFHVCSFIQHFTFCFRFLGSPLANRLTPHHSPPNWLKPTSCQQILAKLPRFPRTLHTRATRDSFL